MHRVVGACLALLVVVSGCKEDAPEETKLLTVTRSPAAIVANGASTSTISVSGATRVPLTFTTTKGVFVDTGTTTQAVNALTADVLLRSCDAAVVSGCVGAASVSVTDGAGAIGFATVTFTTSEICDNGADDDRDGDVDCADTDCPTGVQCSATGLVCSSGRTCSQCGGAGGVAQPAGETSCNDGYDNDCDGSIDCADPSCAGLACATATLVGTCSGGACVCEQTETAELSCSDGKDNDCDGLADCDDPNCLGKFCDTIRGLVCGGSPVACSVCSTGQASELASQCGDGRDNDCDGAIDCDDTDCAGASCNAFGGICTVQSSIPVCSCATGQVAETVCNDGVDNDCNGRVDCQDTNCAGQQCGPTSASVCEQFECVDTATKYAITLTPARTRLPALAGAVTQFRVQVKFEGTPVIGALVDLGTSATYGTVSPTSVTTNGSGEAVATFTASGNIGVAVITATLNGVGTTKDTQVEMPAVGEIKLGAVQYAVMGVRSSGYQEQNNMSVQVLDVAQRPYPAGLPVRFEHLTLGGSTITLPHAPDVPGTCERPWCLAYQAVTDDDGIARMTLYAGTVAGTVPVYVTTSAGGQPVRAFDLPSVAIIGARASGLHLSVVCDPTNVPALASTTCYSSLILDQTNCVAILKDRFNNMIGRATTVTFMSEAGGVGPPTTTPAYDPTKDPSGQVDLGSALTYINTLGNRLPKDVPPHAGIANPYGANLVRGDPRFEHSYFYDDLRCQPATHNPRDGIVTVIASTPGEEGFFDANGNGVYDLGEPFTDLPEPFVDHDDDNDRDPDEPFIDSNGNGSWDPPNGVWDANTKIWTETRIVYATLPRREVDASGERFSRWMNVTDLATFPEPSVAPTPVLSIASGETSRTVLVAATDGNFNVLPAPTRYAVSVLGVGWDNHDGYFGAPSVPNIGTGFSFVYWACDAADLTRCANNCEFANSPSPARCLMRSVLRGYQYGYTAPVVLYVEGAPAVRRFRFEANLAESPLYIPLDFQIVP